MSSLSKNSIPNKHVYILFNIYRLSKTLLTRELSENNFTAKENFKKHLKSADLLAQGKSLTPYCPLYEGISYNIKTNEKFDMVNNFLDSIKLMVIFTILKLFEMPLSLEKIYNCRFFQILQTLTKIVLLERLWGVKNTGNFINLYTKIKMKN